MYLNKYHTSYVQQKEVSQCSKIFRPWDNFERNNKVVTCTQTQINKALDNCAQDATISTTTENDDNRVTSETNNTKCDTKLIKEDSDYQKIESKDNECSKGFRRLPTKNNKKANNLDALLINNHSLSEESIEAMPAFVDYPGNVEGYSMYPEFVHANLAHSLGLTPADPLFLECVNQGCTLEEYTRVLSQEHQAKILNARKQRPKKYRCPHCDVGFSNNGQLKGHIRIHTGERPFRCDENNCGKTFTRNEELTRHKRIHSGLRPFPCTHCGKRFGRKDHLKKHSRTHFQPRGLYAVPVMLPFETWTASPAYPYVPMFTY